MMGREWIKPGAKVVLINTGGWNSRVTGESTVTKVGKRDVVLANGRRFRVSDLHEQGRDRYYGDQIVSPLDPRLAEIRAEDRRRDRKNRAKEAVNTWQRDSDNSAAAHDAIIALYKTLSGPHRRALGKALGR